MLRWDNNNSFFIGLNLNIQITFTNQTCVLNVFLKKLVIYVIEVFLNSHYTFYLIKLKILPITIVF